MKRAFTLIEMLVVVAVLVTLMMIVFRLSSIGGDADNRTRTIVRMQRLENCLSGYHAAFGSYPPVKLHGTRDLYERVGSHGIQTRERNTAIWNWDPEKFRKWRDTGKGQYYQQNEVDAWYQVEAACKSQPVGCRFPYPRGYSELIRILSDEMKERASSGDEEYSGYWQDPGIRAKLSAGFDDGGSEKGDSGATGRFKENMDKVDWRDIQLFKFGLMSFLLPRYLVMMNGAQAFYNGGFAQWDENNVMPCDPFTGRSFSEAGGWDRIKQYAESSNKGDLAHLANIPSQSICARWMPNLAGICHCNHTFALFGVDINSGEGSELRSDNLNIEIFCPHSEKGNSNKDQYILDGISVQDGWWRDFYYYSPEPYQTYTIWSAGRNGRTFPPWISRQKLSAKQNSCVAVWVDDDIIHMSN